MKFQLNGRRIYESTKTKNKKFAEEIFLNRRNEIINGITPVSKKEIVQKYSFNELSVKYLEYTDGRLKSHGRLKYFIKTLNDYFSEKIITKFSVLDIENMQSDIMKKGYSISYANRLTAILKRTFTKAADWELVDDNILKTIRKAKLLKGETYRLRYLADDEIDMLISNCDSYLKPVVITALNTGMRKSEILQLTWDRVDLKNRIILLDKTKNGDRREIPMNDTLLDMLFGIIRRIDVPYVFYNPETLKPYDNFKRSFGTALRKSHITDFHFHDLRHTFASRLIMKGVDLTTVKELLGHKDIKMTLRYSHLSQAHVKNAVKVLDNDRCKIVAVDYEEEIEKL